MCGQNLSMFFQGKGASKTGLKPPCPEFGSEVIGCLQSVIRGH